MISPGGKYWLRSRRRYATGAFFLSAIQCGDNLSQPVTLRPRKNAVNGIPHGPDQIQSHFGSGEAAMIDHSFC